jgi:Amidohydrolase family
MKFTSHHDAPVAFPDSMRVLDATVTRVARGSGKVIGPQHRVDVITALKAMTIWPAWQHYEEAGKGSIEVGKLADLVILSRDPTQGDVNTIDRIKVSETIKEGRSVFTLGAQAPRQAGVSIEPSDGWQGGFQRFLAGAAAYSDAVRAPLPLQASLRLPRLTSQVHDAACVSGLLSELSAAMLVGEPTQRR